jgi:transposase
MDMGSAASLKQKFDEARDPYFKQASFYLECYREIYRLNAESKDQSLEEIARIRQEMRPFFEQMKIRGKQDLEGVSNKSSLAKAINYFMNNYEGLTYFIQDAAIPIDNNAQERLLRSPVIGRKTWFGTHSIKGAITTAIMFSIIETCKLNKVNPREYFNELVKVRLANKVPPTPWDYAGTKNSN